MPAYDATRFNPPAPMANVTLYNPANAGKISNVAMLMDLGSDVTIVPEAYALQIGITPLPGQNEEVMGFDGNRKLAPIAQLEIHFVDRIFRGRFLLGKEEYGILGRNILNLLSLLFDGPRLTWSDQRPVMKK